MSHYLPGFNLSNITSEKLKKAIPDPTAWRATLPKGTTQKDMWKKFRADYETNNGRFYKRCLC